MSDLSYKASRIFQCLQLIWFSQPLNANYGLQTIQCITFLQKNYDDSSKKWSRVGWAVTDTLIWQGLASVAIPGFTINRICTYTGVLLKRGVSWPGPTRKWVTTAVGLLSIPFIIKPIDRSVDFVMENSLRKWYHVGPVLKDLVHHNRNDWTISYLHSEWATSIFYSK